MESYRKIYFPSTNLIGPGVVREIGTEIKNLGLQKLLVVTDKILNKIGVVKQVTDVLDASAIKYTVYDEVKPNPTTKNVNDGLKLFKDEKCDGLLSIGGGSPQDTAKAVGILATNGGNILDYNGVGLSKHKAAPIIAVNTTAGTASEVTINYVITDEVRKTKMVIIDPNCLATIAVNDPVLMLNKPAGLTAATGMDALTHAIEAYITKGAFRLSDTLSLEAVKIIGEALETAVNDGKNIEARSKMAWGSYIAGLAFSNCGLGIVHSMAHQLGSEYDLPHGVANAILLPFVEDFNSKVCPEKFADIAKALGKNIDNLSVEEACKAALDAIKELSVKVRIPKLKDTSFKIEDVDKLAKQAMKDACTPGNPREVTAEDIKKIYIAAYNG